MTEPDATLRGAEQLLGRNDADIVGTPDEILDIDRLGRMLSEPRATDKRLLALLEDVRTRLRRHASRTILAIVFDPVSQ